MLIGLVVKKFLNPSTFNFDFLKNSLYFIYKDKVEKFFGGDPKLLTYL